jgi:hypothetical protein
MLKKFWHENVDEKKLTAHPKNVDKKCWQHFVQMLVTLPKNINEKKC